MVDDNYEVYIQFKDYGTVYKSILFKALDNDSKRVVSIIYEIAKENYKKFILTLNAPINPNSIIMRVYSTGENSKKHVDIICSFDFILNHRYDIVHNVIKDSVRDAIELTIKEMGVIQ